jgi:5'(3')-deoxyribonucleotidase
MKLPGELKRWLQILGASEHRRPLVAIDVDLTFVDTLTPYLEWFKKHTGKTVPQSVYEGSYDLNPYYEQNGVDGHAFWKQTDLYDGLVPLPGAVAKLAELSEIADIVFVSKCYPEHITSKVNMLKKFCLFPHEFIATGAKWLVDYDLLIDDSWDVMSKSAPKRPRALHLLFDTIMTRKFDADANDMVRLYSWAEI